ncbi:CinA family nicotinamide mononucleotide deamidase-related protein [Vibrio agarivorans]|uniref:CinA-like protein n=1 Tax=Vibrio agarivorans TaxID=153622 RepID=A0ABT7XZ34_9VIBR|nr:CinA family nicotinamide mononucleotide deamidase-related protein [Vibrio agarivorans]MDN2481021.1 CinA family nicotinamide mononucleotide deamidase-related protein [Vibrio agarivorans]
MTKIAMLSTGEEVLHGDIVDTNAAWLSEYLFEQGLALTKRSTVGDQLSTLIEELVMLSFNNDIVIVNGGLGPTSDDMSAEAIAAAAEVELELHEPWVTHMETFFASRGKVMPESNIKQAMLPVGSELIDNPIGTACGFKVKLNDCDLYFTPGVPREFKQMIQNEVCPRMKASVQKLEPLRFSRFYTFGSTESQLSDILAKFDLPPGYSIGYRSALPFIEVKLMGPTDNVEVRVKLVQMLYQLIADFVVSIDEKMMAHIGHLLVEKGLTVSLAEESTYGYLSYWANSDKQAQSKIGSAWVLGSDSPCLIKDNDPMAAALALAAASKERCQSDISVVTGEMDGKTFSIAIATEQGEWGQVLSFNRQYSDEDARVVIATIAMDMLRRVLSATNVFANYAAVTRSKELFIPASMLTE